jgi:hypothetical protein
MRWILEDLKTGWQNMPVFLKVLNVAALVLAFVALGIALAAL